MVLHRPIETTALIGEIEYWSGRYREIQLARRSAHPYPCWNNRMNLSRKLIFFLLRDSAKVLYGLRVTFRQRRKKIRGSFYRLRIMATSRRQLFTPVSRSNSRGNLVQVATCGEIDKVCGSGACSVFFFVGNFLHKRQTSANV